jgi:hypothetical protein
LKKNVTYTSLVEVRNDGLKAYLNGEMVAQYKTDYKDMDIIPHWKLPDPMLLGVGSWLTAMVIEKLEVREVTGKGTFTRGAPSPSAAPVTSHESRITSALSAFCAEVAALPAEQQVARVVAKLKELNPGFDPATSKLNHKIENGLVTEFEFVGKNITDLSPVRALTGVKNLKCGSDGSKIRLADLSALQGLQLMFLDCKYSLVRDLSPLRGMPLTELNCCATSVDDLSPLKGMSLTRLICYSTKVEDLSPLTGAPLETLECYNTRVNDLSPLKGMPLKTLLCAITPIKDLTPLQGLPLEHLNLNNSPVSDLSPLAGMPLKILRVHSTQVRDLTVLRDMPLMELWCDFVPQRDTVLLRSVKTLKKINDLPAAEFWRKVEAGEVPKAK